MHSVALGLGHAQHLLSKDRRLQRHMCANLSACFCSTSTAFSLTGQGPSAVAFADP